LKPWLPLENGRLVSLHYITHTTGRPPPNFYEGGGTELEVSVPVDKDASTSGSFFLGLFRSSRVIPPVSLVIPTQGGSPFLTNSHWPTYALASQLQVRRAEAELPGSLTPASRKASRMTCSWIKPLISKTTWLTATLVAQWSNEPFPLPILIFHLLSAAAPHAEPPAVISPRFR
jgi:hypothetical protein